MEEKQMSFLDHAGVLRKYLIRAFIFFAIGFVISFFNKTFIFDKVILILKNQEFITYKVICRISEFLDFQDSFCIEEIPITIQNRKLTGQFFLHITTSLVSGLILAFPFITWQFWAFIRPALKSEEIKKIRSIYFFINVLFLIGIFFGYFVISPISINFLSNYSVSDEIVNEIDLSSFIGIVSSIILASGITFLLPIFIFFLTKLGIVDYITLKKYRRHAFILIVIFSAIITPPDVSSQILIAIPLSFLYEISIFISKKNFIKK